MVQAAAGGIGLFLCQMEKIRAGRVIGITSKQEKAQYVTAAGADEVIISTQSDIAKEVKRITNGQGVYVVYDGVGKDTFEANLNSLSLGGYFISYGQSSGYVPPFDLMTLQEKGSLFITRTNGLPYMKNWSQYIQDFVTWIQNGKLSIQIDRTYSLIDAPLAHEAVERIKTSGRILLIP
ncbi:zinc-binding dehydrogenase [Bacillus bingmayongensis]|uniref:zinc-binding dehydrogenase n=2 Tax=Bacillus bingmayongensis TaxID=1150157 RepID=UPI0002F2B664|nr:zinc-binding dehydrogenase [Bacillus bingmayongensis]